MTKIALSMIVLGSGDEYKKLDIALSSIAPHVDGIYITLTGYPHEIEKTEEVCKKYNAVVSYFTEKVEVTDEIYTWTRDFLGYEPVLKTGTKIFDFSSARNYALSQIPQEYDWIFWIDADDIVRGAEHLHALADYDKSIEAYYMNYLYQTVIVNGEIKSVVIEHWRERLVRNNGHFKWIAPIHETLIEQVPTQKTNTKDVDVVHLATLEDRIASLTRNLPNLELAIYQSKGEDPRHLYYLAKAYIDFRTEEYNSRAIPLIHAYLYGEHKSGWPQERSQASLYLSDLYRRKDQINNAIKSSMNALIEDPRNPMIFLDLATSYVYKKDYERALFWVKQAGACPENDMTTLVKNPRDLQGITLEILYNCYLNMGKIDKAWSAAHEMEKIAADDPNLKNVVAFIDNLRTQRDVTRMIMKLADFLTKTGEIHKIKPLLSATPAIAVATPFFADLEMKHNPPTYFDENHIAIYCGQGFTPWSPKKLDNPGECFVGGSEEAVIRMSRELAQLGWKVTIYGDPGVDEGEYEGVTYLPHYKFNRLDRFNILIAWRQPKFFENELKYKKGYVWLHDIQSPLDYTENAIAKTTKFMFLSKWHRDNVPALPEDKVFMTSNGI